MVNLHLGEWLTVPLAACYFGRLEAEALAGSPIDDAERQNCIPTQSMGTSIETPNI
ncbi:hypothetical protein HYR99_35790 [Candidatus Poribacteria bacterium]|nr:hypothetical protein [Candidatus Poribacteria bacterium]